LICSVKKSGYILWTGYVTVKPGFRHFGRARASILAAIFIARYCQPPAAHPVIAYHPRNDVISAAGRLPLQLLAVKTMANTEAVSA
jgi:hypothetical protein